MAKSNMLGPASSCSSSPKSERIRFQLTSHQLDNLTRRKSKLGLDRVERSPVLPRHLDDPIKVVCGERHVCQSLRNSTLVFLHYLTRSSCNTFSQGEFVVGQSNLGRTKQKNLCILARNSLATLGLRTGPTHGPSILIRTGHPS